MTTGYYQKSGKWWIDKDPNAKKKYSIDLAQEVALSGSSLNSVTAIYNGVSKPVSEPDAFVTGTKVTAWVEGGTMGESDINSVTFRYVLLDGQTDDATIYFKMKEK